MISNACNACVLWASAGERLLFACSTQSLKHPLLSLLPSMETLSGGPACLQCYTEFETAPEAAYHHSVGF